MKSKRACIASILLILVAAIQIHSSAAVAFEDDVDEWSDDEFFGRDRFGKPIPDEYENDGSLTLHAESIKYTINADGDRGGYINCRINNFSDQNISFIGYYHYSPWHRIQIWQNSSWAEYDVGWFCGTGLDAQVLNSGKSAAFTVAFPDHTDQSPLKIRVGLDVSVAVEIKFNDAYDDTPRVIPSGGGEVWTNEILLDKETAQYND